VAFVTRTAGSPVQFFPAVGGQFADVYAGGSFVFNVCPDAPTS
jgi:hypothetical protein